MFDDWKNLPWLDGIMFALPFAAGWAICWIAAWLMAVGYGC